MLDNLNKLDIFSALSPESMKHVLRLMKRQDVAKGWILFREGSEGSVMYVVLSGTVSISIAADNQEELEVARVGAGSFFGEMSILEKDVRSATCRAEEDCVLLSLNAENFRRLMLSHPETAIGIMQRMLQTATGRLQKTGAFLSEMVQWGQQARMRAVRDEFTGLYNRRFFDEALQEAVLNTRIEDNSFSLVMVDLDRFGTLNAEYGEATGDAVILAAVKVFKQIFNESSNILCRYGGDEFAFILPGKNGREVLEACRKIRSALASLNLLKEKKGTVEAVTATIGIAEYPLHGTTVRELTLNADKALYAAKKAGRDRAMLYNRKGEE